MIPKENIPPEVVATSLFDRHILRKRLTFWRAFTFTAIAVILILLSSKIFNADRNKNSDLPQKFEKVDHIARLSFEGVVPDDPRYFLKRIKKISENSHAKALILDIDSPGGSPFGSEEILAALRDLSAKKPSVTRVRSLAASGGYVIALGTDHIIAAETSTVGSIGAIFLMKNYAELLNVLGIKTFSVRSSPLKAQPNEIEPIPEGARESVERSLKAIYFWFKQLVKKHRKMTDEELEKVSDGQVYLGTQSLKLKLIDAIGLEKDAVAWLEKEKKVKKNLKIFDYDDNYDDDDDKFFEHLFKKLAALVQRAISSSLSSSSSFLTLKK